MKFEANKTSLLVEGVVRYLMLVAALSCAESIELFCQEHAVQDSAGVEPWNTPHRIEAGVHPLGVGLEYRYQWYTSFSTDILASVERPGIGVALTFSPLWIFYVQGVFGTGTFKEEATADGPPPFKPSYLYGWDAGIHFPLAPKKTNLYLIFGFGQVRYVQNHYNYNGGGLLVGPPPTPQYRTETRSAEAFSVGLGFSF